MRETWQAEQAKFESIEFLGEGLSSRVYKAIRRDSRGHSLQNVVLKVLKAKEEVSWFEREFQILEKLRSPHCVRVLGWENLPQGPSLILEFVDGISLDRLARRFGLSDDLIDEVTRQILLGLKDLKNSALFHGDLSPQNILIDRQGQVKLIDFGAASTGPDLLGTPAYLAPEVWETGRKTLASDYFALGLIRQDLRNRPPQLPSLKNECLGRLREMLNCEPLCHENPDLRETRLFLENPLAKLRLGEFSSEILDEYQNAVAQTLVIARPKVILPKWVGVAIAILLLFVPVFLRPPAKISRPAFATLQIRPVHWVQASIDGQHLEFSPLSFLKLEPGRHVVHWKNQKHEGEVVVLLRPGERRILHDEMFIPAKPMSVTREKVDRTGPKPYISIQAALNGSGD